MLCPNCREPVEENAVMCYECGMDLTRDHQELPPELTPMDDAAYEEFYEEEFGEEKKETQTWQVWVGIGFGLAIVTVPILWLAFQG